LNSIREKRRQRQGGSPVLLLDGATDFSPASYSVRGKDPDSTPRGADYVVNNQISNGLPMINGGGSQLDMISEFEVDSSG